MKCISNIINNIFKRWYYIIIVILCLTGCSAQPDLVMEGFQTERFLTEKEQTERELQMDPEQIQEEQEDQKEQKSKSESEIIHVFVCGAVKLSGVYQLQKDARVHEAIEAAGGFSKDADKEWLNLDAVLQDGEKLYIYTVEETSQMKLAEEFSGSETTVGSISEPSDREGKINLNTAAKELLMTLPGIGETRADAVIAYREAQGGFDTIEEIMNISGIKEAVFLKIKDRIVV